MSLLSYYDLCQIVEHGVITPVDPDCINAASIDIRLGKTIKLEQGGVRKNQVSLRDKEALHMVTHDLEKDGPFILAPGSFILAHSMEEFNLPNNISAEYKLKSSMARIGLEHLNAGWCDAGWNGSVLTLELRNMTQHHTIVLRYGDRIGQMVFFGHREVPKDRSYAARGRYNGDKTVSGVKKERIEGETERTPLGNRILSESEIKEFTKCKHCEE